MTDTRAEITGSAPHDGTAHVLVICPDADDTRGVREWLAAENDPALRVTHIDSLDAGVSILAHSRVEALVLDLSTAGIRPLDACRELRAVTPDVPIVLIAPPEQEAVAAQALLEGADHYVIKGPSDGRVVASTVCNALRQARAETELRHERERRHRLLDLLDDGVASLDAKGYFVEANRAMARMLGYDRAHELSGLSLRDVYAGPETADAVLERLASSGALPRGEAELLSLGGARLTVLLRAHRLHSGGDQAGEFELVCTDVTTERRLEQEARETEPLARGGTFAIGVSSEVQRLMAAVTGAHDLLAEVIDDQHPRRPDLQYLREAAEKAAALAEELLVAMHSRTPRPAVLDAAAVLERLQPTFQQTAGEEIFVRLPPDGSPAGEVSCAHAELDEVLVECVSVLCALDREAPVTVSTSPVYLDSTYAREHLALMPGHYVAFLITTAAQSLDTLMAPDWEAERPFSPDTAERLRAQEMARIYRTVNQAGGHLAVRRAPGAGTTLKVYLPRVDTPGRRGTILLVEDEPTIRCGGRQLLELLDYRVLEAADPHEAIWLASRLNQEIDLLIADVVLPGMTGREMAERLIAGGYVSRVLYMSGLLKETLVERSTLPPNVMFIEKPFTMAQLTECIREILP